MFSSTSNVGLNHSSRRNAYNRELNVLNSRQNFIMTHLNPIGIYAEFFWEVCNCYASIGTLPNAID